MQEDGEPGHDHDVPDTEDAVHRQPGRRGEHVTEELHVGVGHQRTVREVARGRLPAGRLQRPRVAGMTPPFAAIATRLSSPPTPITSVATERWFTATNAAASA